MSGSQSQSRSQWPGGNSSADESPGEPCTLQYSNYRLYNRGTGTLRDVQGSFPVIVDLEVSSTHYAGLCRPASGGRWELFIRSLDDSTSHRFTFETSNALGPSLDGSRVVWTQDHDVYLFDGTQ